MSNDKIPAIMIQSHFFSRKRVLLGKNKGNQPKIDLKEKNWATLSKKPQLPGCSKPLVMINEAFLICLLC
jgi:hypothetical protein